METLKVKSPVRSYDTPAVIYEAALVAHAGSTGTDPCATCGLSGGDLLDLTSGK